MKRKKKEIDKTISDLWNRIWDLQDQTNKIKKAVLTGEKGDLKMPERRIVPPDEPIPFGGTVDMDCIFEKEPCEQVDVEFSVKELLQMYKALFTEKVSASICFTLITRSKSTIS